MPVSAAVCAAFCVSMARAAGVPSGTSGPVSQLRHNGPERRLASNVDTNTPVQSRAIPTNAEGGRNIVPATKAKSASATSPTAVMDPR